MEIFDENGITISKEMTGRFEMLVEEDVIMEALNRYLHEKGIDYIIEIAKTCLNGFDEEMLSSPIRINVTPFKRYRD